NAQMPTDGFLLKSVSSNPMDMAGDDILPNHLDPLSNNVNCFRKNGLIHKPG
ncbi:hypothetical protein DBR06_SOUSAS6410075, partial [Sousa chinensis]